MKLADLARGQAVLWRNRGGRLVCATVMDIRAATQTITVRVERRRSDESLFAVDPASLIGYGETVVWVSARGERVTVRVVAVLVRQNAVEIALPDGRVRRVASRSLE